MKNTTINTDKSKSGSDSLQFYILSKGFNAGKPMKEPSEDCFIVTGKNSQDKGKLFWICYSIWKSGTYVPLLRGSVIPFLRLSDVASEISKGIEFADIHESEFDATVIKLQELIRTEKLLSLQLRLIDGIKSSLTRKIMLPARR